MKFFLLLLIVLTAGVTSNAKGKEVASNEKLLLRLDSILGKHREIIEKKEFIIGELKKRLAATKNPEKKLYLLRDIYSEYKKYDPDSAIFYAHAIEKLFKELPSNEDLLKTESKILLAGIYANQGFFEESEHLLNEIDPSILPEELKIEFYQSNIMLYSAKATYLSENNDIVSYDPNLLKIAEEYGDSLLQTGDRLSLIDYLWMKVAMSLVLKNKEVDKEVISKMENFLKENSDPSISNAINAYWLAQYYESIDDNEKAFNYLIMSAIYDALSENRDISAISEIGAFLLEKGDPERAYNYLMYALQQANAYHNRSRMVELSTIMPEILEAYKKMRMNRDSGFRGFIIALSIISFILIFSIIILICEYRRKNRISRELAEVNHNLEKSVKEKEEAIESLEKTRLELEKSQEVERNMLTFTISIAAHYMNAIESFRKKLLTLFKSNRLREIESQLNNEEISKEQYSEFYRDFDNVVLSIWPDIVKDYNKMVAEMDKPQLIIHDSSGELNTRLRIYALTLLGIDKSADQAKILNLSIRTIYNNRL